AAGAAETIVGLRPSSLSAAPAARVLLSLMRGITTGCLSYALKGKLPAGLCLIIIGTEGGRGVRVVLTHVPACMPKAVCYIYYAMDKNTKDILEAVIFIKDRMATKDDIADLRSEVADLRTEFVEFRTETRENFAE